MEDFTISRIDTSEGIFRLSGRWQQTPNKLILAQLEIMATDGWQKLDLNHQTIIHLNNLIEEQIITHLISQNY